MCSYISLISLFPFFFSFFYPFLFLFFLLFFLFLYYFINSFWYFIKQIRVFYNPIYFFFSSLYFIVQYKHRLSLFLIFPYLLVCIYISFMQFIYNYIIISLNPFIILFILLFI